MSIKDIIERAKSHAPIVSKNVEEIRAAEKKQREIESLRIQREVRQEASDISAEVLGKGNRILPEEWVIFSTNINTLKNQITLSHAYAYLSSQRQDGASIDYSGYGIRKEYKKQYFRFIPAHKNGSIAIQNWDHFSIMFETNDIYAKIK